MLIILTTAKESAWSPKQTQEFELYPQASPLAEWLCIPSGTQMNMGSNPAVGAGFFPARKTGVCYGYGAGVALGSQTPLSIMIVSYKKVVLLVNLLLFCDIQKLVLDVVPLHVLDTQVTPSLHMFLLHNIAPRNPIA